MAVGDEGNERVVAWSVDTLEPDVCVATTGQADAGWLPVTLDFVRGGATDLFVYDDEGIVVDWQPIEVRDVSAAEVYAFDAAASGAGEALDSIHAIAGSEGSLVVAWLDATGALLLGTGLLAVATVDNELSLAPPEDVESYPFEVISLAVDADASPGDFSFDIAAAGAVVGEVPVVVHDKSEIAAVRVSATTNEDEEDGTTWGVVSATVSTAEVDLFGVSLTWLVDGEEVGEGTWARFEGEGTDDLHELTACRKDLCDTLTLPGTIVETGTDLATSPPGDCGCGLGATATAAAAALSALVGLSRRKRD
jgi:hypothetical protein